MEVLHDRALPGSQGNTDHIVVGPSGVFVEDAKRHQGKAEARRGGAGAGPGAHRLLFRLVSRHGPVGHDRRLGLARRPAAALPASRASTGRQPGLRPVR